MIAGSNIVARCYTCICAHMHYYTLYVVWYQFITIHMYSKWSHSSYNIHVYSLAFNSFKTM